MQSFYLTDAGKVRDHNEDSVTIVKNKNNEYLMIVADGMGGHRAGEVASSMVVTHLGKRFCELSTIGNLIDATSWLEDNVQNINESIIKFASENSDAAGMGTTIVVALLTKDFLLMGNIGDSPGFVLKNKKLHKATKEHTLVNALVESGDLTPEQAANHPKKNVLTRALGASDKVSLDIYTVDMESEAIFLCSDGLTNMLSVEQIERVLNDDELSIEEKVVKLILKGNARGGTDNISVAYLIRNKEGEK